MAKDEQSGVQFGNLILPDRYKSCWVIDGQHRLYGTAFTENDYKVPLFFVAFDKVSPSQEANIFVEINAKQATVPATLLSALDGEVKWDSSDPKERLAAIASRAVDLMNTRGNGPLEGKVISPGIGAATGQPLNLRSVQERIILSNLLGHVDQKGGEIIPGPCWSGSSEASLQRLTELLNLHFDEVREANPDRWELGRAGALCSNLGVGSQIRLLSELIRYAAFKDHFFPSKMDVDELYESIRPYLTKMFAYIKQESDEAFRKRFTVIFGSSGYHEYFFKLFELISEDVPGLLPEGFAEYQKTSSAEVIEKADKAVKWIQTVVPMYIKDRLRNKFGDNYFEDVVPAEVQKTCHGRRIDAPADERLPAEEYLDWIQYARLASLKDIRDETKAVVSIRLPDEPGGKHFYSGWFDLVNRLRRISAYPGKRNYKEADLEALGIIVEHLSSNLPETAKYGVA